MGMGPRLLPRLTVALKRYVGLGMNVGEGAGGLDTAIVEREPLRLRSLLAAKLAIVVMD